MMLRTQVQFTEEQHRRLRALAQREGVSIAEAVRRSVMRYLDDQSEDRRDRYTHAGELVGRFCDRDGASDLSDRHDDYLDEGFK